MAKLIDTFIKKIDPDVRTEQGGVLNQIFANLAKKGERKVVEGIYSLMPEGSPRKERMKTELFPTTQPTAQPVKPTIAPLMPTPSTVPTIEPQTDPFRGLKQVKPPPKYTNLVLNSAKETGLPPALLAAMLWNESGYQPNARNGNDLNGWDRGIAQINSKAFPNITDEQADDPNFAIPFMAKTIKAYLDQGRTLSEALAAYNVGLGRTGKSSDRPTGLGPKGQAYVKRVSKNLSPEFVQELGI